MSIFLIVLLLTSGMFGCRLGNGFSLAPKGGLLGIPIELARYKGPNDDPFATLPRHQEKIPTPVSSPGKEQNFAQTTTGFDTNQQTLPNVSPDVFVSNSLDANPQIQSVSFRGVTNNNAINNDTAHIPSTIAGTIPASNSLPGEMPQNGYFPQTVMIPKPLTEDVWVPNLELERYRAGQISQVETPWRWRHKKLEEIQRLPLENQPDYEALLTCEAPIVRANAAILLARSGGERVGNALEQVVNDVSLSQAMRCAAIESLASLKSTTVERLLVLSDTYTERTDSNGNMQRGVPLLAIEVLYALADKKPLSHEPCFMKPLESRDPKIRLAAISVWRDHPPQSQTMTTLPDCIAKYCADPNPAVCEAAITTVAVWRHPDAMHGIDLGLRSPMANVRQAAIRSLGILRTEESVAKLKPFIHDTSAAIRAEVVLAYSDAGMYDQAFQMSNDPRWEVRNSVAAVLARFDDRRSVDIAKKYINDPSPIVQTTLLNSMQGWNPEIAAPILFEAMGSNVLATRQRAAELLSCYWEPARDFRSNENTVERKRNYDLLGDRFQHDLQSGVFGISNAETPSGKSVPDREISKPAEVPAPVVTMDREKLLRLLEQSQRTGNPQQQQTITQQLLDMGPELLPVLERLALAEGRPIPAEVMRSVLPALDPAFGLPVKLECPEVAIRRQAAAELINQTRYSGVSPLLFPSLGLLVVRETDEIVLLRIWNFVDLQSSKLFKNAPSPAAQPNRLQRIPSSAVGDFPKSDSPDGEKSFREQLAVETLQSLEKTLVSRSLALDSPELHRLACNHLRDYGRPGDVPQLLNEIHHPTPSVVRAALQALARIGDQSCIPPVRPLLTHPQPLVVVDAALALHAWGDSMGTNMLERLAWSGDRTTKLAVAQGMKRGRDRRFVPILIHLLDESGSIRQEALDALPMIVGKDVLPPDELASISEEERINLWKQFALAGQLERQ
ncbi:MAG: HEAT repeat domain-containing protein [Planctomycetaceae bacterium]|nr:HEAT repeat domain-containing protein [Planctomycetaceae bacterium]